MRHRTLLLTTLGLGAVALALLWLEPSREPAGADERPLVPAALLADLRAIEITSGGKTTRLERSPEGWVVPARFGLRADANERLRPLLQSLRSAKTAGILTADPARLARLGLEDNAIKLEGTDGKSLKISMGRMTDDGLGVAARPEGENPALRTTFSGHLEGDPANWIDPMLFSVNADEVLGLALNFPDGSTVKLTREKSGEPMKGADAATLAAAGELMMSLANLRAGDAVSKDDPAAKAALAQPVVAELWLPGGAKVTLRLGRGPAPAPGNPPTGWMTVSHSDPAHPVNAAAAKALFTCQPWLVEQMPTSAKELAARGQPPQEVPGAPIINVEPAQR
jgi:hypothetical protein